MRISRLAVAAAALALCGSAHATEFIKNGDFGDNGGPGWLGNGTFATYWNVQYPNFAFLFHNGTDSGISLWTDGNGGNNGWNGFGPSPYYVGMDVVAQVQPLTQQVDNLTPGQHYTLSFRYAFAEQQGYTGDSSQQWQFSLGGQSGVTPVGNIASQGFSGWQTENYTFTTSKASELLSFIGSGGPGVPPFALLSNVSLTQSAPGPGLATGPLAVLGLLALGYARRRSAQVK